MKAGSFQHRAILISHVLPDVAGGDCQRRAWQLLALLARRCRVDLFCLAGGPVHWETYCRAHQAAHRMWVEPGGSWRDGLARLLRPMAPVSVHRGQARRLAAALQSHVRAHTALVAVCTHPRLVLEGCVPPAPRCVCDLAQAPAYGHGQAAARLLEQSDLLLTADRLMADSLGADQKSNVQDRVLALPRMQPTDSPFRAFPPAVGSEQEALFWFRLRLDGHGKDGIALPLAKAA